ncbi:MULTISPECIES: EcsC family protein [Bacillus]|uniref:EcsC family protein n=1 Tax=Bacillus TaxID=1386 RepID=UPI00240E5324|nr:MULTISPECIES: EcsC family protein [Bacillus]WEZ16755.1 EcsC family protein [Bacillus safensis]WMT29182.1 EcsC family protein [Bacillus aerius]
MGKELTQHKMVQLLDWCFEKSLNGFSTSLSAKQLAEDYLKKHQSREDAVNAIIRWQTAKVGATGFLTGVGGVMTLPVAVPTDMVTNLYNQIRMIACIAYLRGYDLQDDKVKTFVYICLIGKSGIELIEKLSLTIGGKLVVTTIHKVPRQLLVKINQKVGFRLVTKFGSKGAVNLIKLVPIAGGVINGSFNASGNMIIAKVAKEVFVPFDTLREKAEGEETC